MNNNAYIPYNQKKQNPNKKKKCSCEDKYGPKPFTNENTSQSNNIKNN